MHVDHARPQNTPSGIVRRRRSTSRWRTFAASVAVLGLVAACADDGDDADAPVEDPATEATDATPDGTGSATTDEVEGDDAATGDEPTDGTDDEGDDAQDTDDAAAGPAVDPAEVGADELGLVPVLMYHQLLEGGGGDYDLTPEEFRGELEWLFDNDYRPITTAQLTRGEIDVPAGTTPVVLTFDDSTRSQAAMTEDGELDPDTALGILVEVAEAYDDVEPRASVYVITSSLFGEQGDGEDILNHLHGLGMEIGNHTHNHPSLASLDAAGVQEELATNVAEVTSIVDGAEVVTLALPLGIFPEDRSLVAEGSAEVGDYVNEGVLLVGSNPAPSPHAAEFDSLAIPRIRSSPSWEGGEPDYGSAFWLEQLERGEAYRRYVSDGDPDTISFPAEHEDDLDPDLADRANPY